MNNWSISILIFVACSIVFQTNAQTAITRTIEVTVRDTAFLKTTKITYLLNLDPNMAYWEENSDEEEYYGDYSDEEEIIERVFVFDAK